MLCVTYRKGQSEFLDSREANVHRSGHESNRRRVAILFYDINGKLIIQPSAQNKVEFSFYNGQDILDIFRDGNNDGNGFLTSYSSGNASQSFQWAHAFPGYWSGDLSLTRSQYDYNISNAFEENQLMATSDIEDYSARITVRRDSLPGNAFFQSGAEWIRHAISPSVINSSGTIAKLLESSASNGKLAHELAIHLQHEFFLTPALLIIRLSKTGI